MSQGIMTGIRYLSQCGKNLRISHHGPLVSSYGSSATFSPDHFVRALAATTMLSMITGGTTRGTKYEVHDLAMASAFGIQHVLRNFYALESHQIEAGMSNYQAVSSMGSKCAPSAHVTRPTLIRVSVQLLNHPASEVPRQIDTGT